MKAFRRCSASVLLVAVFSVHSLPAQDKDFRIEGQQIAGPRCLIINDLHAGDNPPCSEREYADWLKDIHHWKNERLIRIGYNDARYQDPALRWTQSSFIQPQMMVHDRYLYDPVKRRYTVDRYLDDLEKRYGGIDAVLVWPTYPNMGIDDRNQHDMIQSMPGGVAGVREMIDSFHRRGVRVLFPMMMWDQGTRDAGTAWPDAVAGIMKQVGADGVNGDTQDGVPLAFSQAAEKVGHPLVFEPENTPSDEALAWNVMTWGQYRFPFVPEIDHLKWLEPRHMVNISHRWNRAKTDDLQFAFFNGVGWESWENIWGIWNGITDRDAEATRRVSAIERAVAPFLVSADWQPLYPMRRFGIYASRWPLDKETVWTIVNRGEYDVDGPQINVPAEDGMNYFDLYHGVPLTPQKSGNIDILSFSIEAHGYGAVLATPNSPATALQTLMLKMKKITEKPLREYPDRWSPLLQAIVEIAPTKPATSAPDGMIKIPAGKFLFKVQGREIEGGNDIGVDVQFPWESAPQRFHEHSLEIRSFYIDKFPVTNADFKRFLDATHYRPGDDLNFLRDWKDGTYPAGWDRKPVTWVSLEDARAYAQWKGKRLPHEWEWQYAAQGDDNRAFPWGQVWRTDAVPASNRSRSLTSPDAVDAHPEGASPFGVMDMTGNVWQWTDEYRDEHTRAAIVRGGSYYSPQGSEWYFPQAHRNDEHGKLLLMAPSLDRSGTVGFRCVQDAE